jgi:hypothetical protein
LNIILASEVEQSPSALTIAGGIYTLPVIYGMVVGTPASLFFSQ